MQTTGHQPGRQAPSALDALPLPDPDAEPFALEPPSSELWNIDRMVWELAATGPGTVWYLVREGRLPRPVKYPKRGWRWRPEECQAAIERYRHRNGK